MPSRLINDCDELAAASMACLTLGYVQAAWGTSVRQKYGAAWDLPTMAAVKSMKKLRERWLSLSYGWLGDKSNGERMDIASSGLALDSDFVVTSGRDSLDSVPTQPPDSEESSTGGLSSLSRLLEVEG